MCEVLILLDHNNRNTDVVETIGDRLKQALDDAEMKQNALARAIGVTPQSINQIINGQSKQPKTDNMLHMAEVLSCSPRWLVFGKGPKQPAASRTIDRDLLATIMAATEDALIRRHVKASSQQKAKAIAGVYKDSIEKGLTADTFDRSVIDLAIDVAID